jgi:hypothetical protein
MRMAMNRRMLKAVKARDADALVNIMTNPDFVAFERRVSYGEMLTDMTLGRNTHSLAGLKVLLAHGATLSRYAACHAAALPDVSYLDLVLEMGADPRERLRMMGAMHMATTQSDGAVFGAVWGRLLDVGMDPHEAHKSGQSPMMAAKSKGFGDIAEKLIWQKSAIVEQSTLEIGTADIVRSAGIRVRL